MKKLLCVLSMTDEELGNLIKGYVDFGKIVHSAPNILKDPNCIREEVAHTLYNIGIPIKEHPNGMLRRTVRLECSDKNGTYYMLCGITHNHELDIFIVSLGRLHKVIEDLDPFSADGDLILTPELVDAQNKAYMKAQIFETAGNVEIECGGDNDPLKGISFK